MDLNGLKVRQRATVTEVLLPSEQRRRLIELGVRHGSEVQLLRRAPFGGPLAIRVGGGLLALRRAQARHILVAGGDDD